MMNIRFALSVLCLSVAGSSLAQDALPTATLDKIRISQAMKVQILLDRAGYSPGEIDGRLGANTKKALRAFQKYTGLKPTGAPDPATLKALEVPGTPFLTYYKISSVDVTWPFSKKLSKDMLELAKLDKLQYTSILELLSEKFHANPAILTKLNPKSRYREGSYIVVPNVTPMEDYVKPVDNGPITITVAVKKAELTVTDELGKVIMFAPITSSHVKAPLPIGRWKVNGIDEYPYFNYNPKLMVKPDPKHKTGGVLPPGPNSPVGVVWIDINVEHVGIHGTSGPSKIGYQASNGCIRLTNWDAIRLAGMVRAGTDVVFVK